MVRVTLKNLTKKYGSKIALNNINLDVPNESFVVLLGPTGAGKSTTLKCISGVVSPDEGEVLFDGVRMNDVPPWDRNVAMFFQTYALYPHLSVYDNIAYPLKERKLNKSEINRKVKEIAKVLHIEHLLERRDPTTLSGGEMQRVALARTLVRDPQVFLLDEPITNLDAKLREEMRFEFKKIHRELAQTVIYATPDYLEALAVGERIAIIKDSQILQYGSPLEIYHHPVNKFVAEFVGSPTINMIPGTIRISNDKIFFNSNILTLDITDLAGNWLKELKSNEILLAIRPQDIEICLSKPPEAIEIKVVACEPIGYVTIITGEIEGKELKAVFKGFLNLDYGKIVWFKPNKNRIHIIDSATEKVVL